jgi:hypothetical protein
MPDGGLGALEHIARNHVGLDSTKFVVNGNDRHEAQNVRESRTIGVDRLRPNDGSRQMVLDAILQCSFGP